MPRFEYAVRFSTCDNDACEGCRSADGDVMTASDAYDWLAGGKEHDYCRCSIDFMTYEEMMNWVEKNPNYISCGGL